MLVLGRHDRWALRASHRLRRAYSKRRKTRVTWLWAVGQRQQLRWPRVGLLLAKWRRRSGVTQIPRKGRVELEERVRARDFARFKRRQVFK